MGDSFSAIKITEDVFWVGAVDWDIRDFHGYSTSRGTTYNAFLILADKVTLIDAVKKSFLDVLLARISSIVEPDKIDYIVSNHAELDHTGALPALIREVKPEKVFACSKGAQNLTHHFHQDLKLEVVNSGDRLSLGNKTLSFMETPMLHWPDSMFTYLEEDKILFSQDALGMHLATSERFSDQIDDYILEFEAAKYYANILMPFSHLVIKQSEKLASSSWNPVMIAPDHGPVWRKDLDKIQSWYQRWAKQEPTLKVVVTYDTMWGSTELMARALSEGLIQAGAQPKMMPLSGSHRSDVATEILEAGGLVVGSPTLNNNMFPTVADVLVYLRGLKPKNLMGTAVGSYGWACKGVPQVEEILREMKVELVGESIKSQFVPTAEVLSSCVKQGRLLAEAIKSRCENN